MALSRTTRRLLYLALLLGAGAALETWQLARIQGWNRAIENDTALAFNGELPPQVVFAQAYSLQRARQRQEALALYQRVVNEGDEDLRAAARFNSANVHLREALTLRGTPAEAQALPLIELAKESYREVLRRQAGDWDARYNLERALRLAPEVEETDSAGYEPPGQERAVTTMKGFSLGLP
ncbi:MAG: hypothetical protein ACREUV_06090 [Burkholderiales bacterium]